MRKNPVEDKEDNPPEEGSCETKQKEGGRKKTILIAIYLVVLIAIIVILYQITKQGTQTFKINF